MSKSVRMTEPVEGGWHEGNADDGTGEWRSYPPAGEVLVTSDDHADSLIASGRAEAVREEKRSAPETRPAPDDAEKRASDKAIADKRTADKAAADKSAALASQQAVASRAKGTGTTARK